MSEMPGAPRGGKGEIESGAPNGEATADDGVDPQLGHMPGVVGDEGEDCADGESVPWLEAFDSARVWDRTAGVGAFEKCVKLSVKNL